VLAGRGNPALPGAGNKSLGCHLFWSGKTGQRSAAGRGLRRI